jgi:hypothetical protein
VQYGGRTDGSIAICKRQDASVKSRRGESGMRRWNGFGILILLAFYAMVKAAPFAAASSDVSITIEKTFDYDTLVDHRLVALGAAGSIEMKFSQRRAGPGSDRIVASYLSLRVQPRPGDRSMDGAAARKLIAEILQAMRNRFGSDLKLVSLSASGFFNVRQIQQDNLQAFAGYGPWLTYLAHHDPRKHSQHEIHQMVVDRWRQKDVYAPVKRWFETAGFSIELSGFEKLFVQRADQFDCFQANRFPGIHSDDRFPYPGMVHFNLSTDSRRPK